MSRIFDRTFGATVDHRWGVSALILAVTGLALLGYIDPDRLTQLFEAPPDETTESASTPAQTYETPPRRRSRASLGFRRDSRRRIRGLLHA